MKNFINIHLFPPLMEKLEVEMGEKKVMFVFKFQMEVL